MTPPSMTPGSIDRSLLSRYYTRFRYFRRIHCSLTPYPRRRGEPIPSAIQEQFMTPDTIDAPDIAAGISPLSQREKRDLQKAQLRPLSNRRPELYEEDEYTSDEYEQMMDMYNGTLASIEEGEIVKSKVLEIRDNLVVLDIDRKST